jgi:hypothetical protein
MVAVPKGDRTLKHISKPLKYQMKHLIDRTRWPVLVTYSDEGIGHSGYVYQCSGWKETTKRDAPFYVDASGARCSSYRNGRNNIEGLTKGGMTVIQRWEHWITDDPLSWMTSHGWRREMIPGKRWRSGEQAYRYVRRDDRQGELFGEA